jgi:chromosome segregation ATPase
MVDTAKSDMLKSTREEDQRKRDEAQFYSMQQQIDELRRQLRENLARQQWFEELYRQGEAKVAQVQTSQERLGQDVAQTLHARQIDEGRVKAQIAELAQKADAPEKQIRDLRAQIGLLEKAIKTDREVEAVDRREIDDLQRQLRELQSGISMVGDSQRQLRDLIQELDTAIGEVRSEALHVAELQRMEEQRLRRQGVELQELFEALRQQFTEVAARSQRVDDVRRQLIERIEAVEEQITVVNKEDETTDNDLDRIEKLTTEHYLALQERLETVRVQIEGQLGEMRQVADQRMDRYMSRFTGTEERLRATEQMLSELPSRFEALERRDEKLGAEADTIEEWLVLRQLAAMENVLEEVRKRRAERASTLNARSSPVKAPSSIPGSVYNPAGLLRSVKDAKPPTKPEKDGEET